MIKFSGKTRVAGVIGWPIGHSKSPLIHNYWLSQHEIDAVYVALPVAQGRMTAAVAGLAALGFVGSNVTVPHKEAALSAAHVSDDLARRIGAANTLVVNDDGTVAATNTDAFGFLENLRDHAADWSARTGPAMIIGAGGAARAVLVALLDDGAPEVLVCNRTPARSETIAGEFGARVRAVPWADRHDAVADARTIINTTSLGMLGQPDLDLSLDRVNPSALVTDIVYTPLRTRLLADAQSRGIATVDGLGMLLHQARPSFKAWFGIMPDVDHALRALVLAA